MDNKNNNSGSSDNPIFPFFPNREQIRSFKRTIPVSVYDFYIVDEIKEVDCYIELIQTLKSADPNDTVFIYLNTPGGNLYTTIQIMSAITTTHAKVITCLEGQVCSAGTFIFLKGDTKLVNPHCTLMVHNYSQSTSGKGNEIVQHINYMGGYFNKLAQDIYQDFLTEPEIKRIMDGEDIWMHSHEVVKRLERYEHDYIYTGEDLEVKVDVDTKLAAIKNRADAKTKTTKKKVTKKKVSRKKP